jgi:hypothetical protein
MTTCLLVSATTGISHNRYVFGCEHSEVQGPIQVTLCTGDNEAKAKSKAEQLVDDNPNGNHNYCQD